jgi:hypothetical protein
MHIYPKRRRKKGWITIPEYSRCKSCPINNICHSAINQENVSMNRILDFENNKVRTINIR